jgi:sialate O-acetylesterase
MSARSHLILTAAAVLAGATSASAAPRLDPIFTDHSVLQRQRPIVVRGSADPGERLTVSFGTARRTARAGSDGSWRVELPAMAAGGPYTLAVTGAGGARAAAEDILIGDVWLCSGQSNMEWPVRQALRGGSEVEAANDSQLRILTVPQRTALGPETSLPAEVKWQPVSPQTVGDFSAACYFMIRDLRASEKVPIGAIDSSWGGTRIRPWMDEQAARAAGSPEDADLLALQRRDPAAAGRRFGEQWGRWWRERTGEAEGAEPWRRSDRLQWKPFRTIGYWEQWGDPAFATFDGYVWARKKLVLTAEEAAGAGTLSLGTIDDLDQTWVNGVGVGSSYGWSLDRNYRLAAGVLREGENEIIVNIGDSWGAGGFQGPAEKLRLTLPDGTVKTLGEGWEYSVVPAEVGAPPRAPWDSHAGLSTIYNAMIAPLGDIGLTGVAWYQGESDVGVPGYAQRLAGMMASWRRQFRSPDLPFLIVSLANYGAPATSPRASGWAELREEQRSAAAADPRAALVVAMDLGEPTDIHPPNKQVLAQRLVRAARALAYGGGVPAGPQVSGARRAGDGIVVEFSGVTGALRTRSGNRALAFELCAATQESCRYADAVAEGGTVRLAADGREVTRIRYAWGESPVVNLYDEAELPPGPFEIPLR